MRLKVSLTAFKIEHIVTAFEDFKDVTNNGQHSQLEGHALVALNMNDGILKLFHPETESSTGHIDVYYKPRTSNNWLQTYDLSPVTGENIRHRWPSGFANLFSVISAVEKHLESMGEYIPLLDLKLNPIMTSAVHSRLQHVCR
ncbi:hypothetical protein COB55_00600 [Candidatus Wolfebacteria bacterium]|nr:MAG: hypothetical protein COB55_00600 [Candidatus Wolfebacteria bacterium]